MAGFIFPSREEIMKYVSKNIDKKLGYGKEGCCFLLKSGIVIKVLVSCQQKEKIIFSVKNNSFVFPKDYILVDGDVNAITMDYVRGKTLLKETPNFQSIAILGSQLEKLLEDVKELSEKHIYVVDTFSGNIIYNKDGFKFIDTLNYAFLKDRDVLKDNTEDVMQHIYEVLLNELFFDKKLYSELSYINNKDFYYKPEEYLLLLKQRIQDTYQEEVNTLEDAKKLILRGH